MKNKFVIISSVLVIIFVIFKMYSLEKEFQESYIDIDQQIENAENLEKEKEEQKEIEEMEFQKEIEEVKNIMPYEGMKEELVPYTTLGKHSYEIEEFSDNCYVDGHNGNNRLSSCDGKIYTFTIYNEVEGVQPYYNGYSYEVIVKVWKNEVIDVWEKNNSEEITIY